MRYMLVDKSNKHSHSGRKLAFQQLEQRLTLSTSTGGGFVNVTTLNDSATNITFDTADTLQISSDNLGNFIPYDLNIGDLDNGINDLDNTNDEPLNQGHNFGTFDNVTGSPVAEVIDPPELIPTQKEGGWVSPVEPQLSEELPSSSEIDSVSTTVSKSSTKNSFNELTHVITPSRGREISFNLASVAPPTTIHRTERIVYGTKSIQLDSTPRSDVKQISQRENNSSTTTPPQAIQTSTYPQPSEPTSTKSGNLPLITFPKRYLPYSDPEKINDKQASSAHLPDSVIQPDAAESDFSEKTDLEARNQAFSDWRKRDLIAFPVLLALLASPRRHQHSPQADAITLQLPPKKKR